MLVITRTSGESFRIGDDVIFEVLRVRDESAKLGIEAPKAVAVHREEIFEQNKWFDNEWRGCV